MEPVPERVALVSHIAQKLAELGVTAITSGFVDLAGAFAFEVRYEWDASDGKVAQSCTFLDTRGAEGRQILCVATSCAKEDADALGPLLDAAVRSLELHPLPSDPEPEETAPTLQRIPTPVPASEAARSSKPTSTFMDAVPIPGRPRST
jgi:hypothetical protein